MDTDNEILLALLALVEQQDQRILRLEADVISLKTKSTRAAGTAYSFTKSNPPALQEADSPPNGKPMPDHVRHLVEGKRRD